MGDTKTGEGNFRVYVGWDSREDIAYRVARDTLLENASIPVDVIPIKLDEMVTQGLYTRQIDPLASTEFTYTRFLVPHLSGYTGWSLFVDCDFLFFGDVAELLDYRDPAHAVACVQHDYAPKAATKMDGVAQTVYPRKNWSSFMLFNGGHPATRALTPEVVNREGGAYLHRMQWAADDQIGSIPTEWNWLDGWNDPPADGTPKAVHYTSGGPWFPDYQEVAYADIWRAKAAKARAEG